MNHDDVFEAELAQITEAGLGRSLHSWAGVGGHLSYQGRHILNFSSNDYLDLAQDPRLKKAASRAVRDYGCSATASRLMSGHLDIHDELERRIADFVRLPEALVFPSGYQANVGVLNTVAGAGDVIFSDQLNHASIVDGCRLSKAAVEVYPHRDMKALAKGLKKAGKARRRVIVSDTVFSMDGDLAPVSDLAELAGAHDAILVVDEAHALGVYGKGAGLCAEHGVVPEVLVANLAKALGGAGGFAAGGHVFRELLLNRARSFIFSTGLPPASAGSAIAAIDIVKTNFYLGKELLNRGAYLHLLLREKGFNLPTPPTQIIPIAIGDNRAAVSISESLLNEDVLVAAVRPPSVPEGTARLRISVTLAHDDADLIRLAEVLSAVCLEAGVL